MNRGIPSEARNRGPAVPSVRRLRRAEEPFVALVLIGAWLVNDDAGWDRTFFEKLCLVYLWVCGIAAVLAVLITLSILTGTAFFGGGPVPTTGTRP